MLVIRGNNRDGSARAATHVDMVVPIKLLRRLRWGAWECVLSVEWSKIRIRELDVTNRIVRISVCVEYQAFVVDPLHFTET